MHEPFATIYDGMDADPAEGEIAAAEELARLTGHMRLVSGAAEGITHAVALCHGVAKRAGWWSDLATGEPKDRNDGELIALMHSELSEALEGLRKSRNDDHLPHRRQVEVELADTLIRIFDYAGARGLDLSGALVEKLAYNQSRSGHKIENRAQADGKKF